MSDPFGDRKPPTTGDLAGTLPDPGEPGGQIQPEIPGNDPSGVPGTGGN